MTFRVARVNDYWRKLEKRSYSTTVDEFSFSGFCFFQDGVLAISPGLTAIVGGNGVGKSTLAQGILGTLDQQSSKRVPRHPDRLVGSTLVLEYKKSGSSYFLKHPGADNNAPDGGGGSIDLSWIDPSLMAMLCQEAIRNDGNFSDVIESIGPRSLTDIELQAASYVVGKDYQSCQVWEVRDWGPFEAWPYFRVRCEGVEYGSEDMGRGELSILCSLWAIHVAPKDSFIVFEEPETHVSVRSQRALMDVVAWAISVKGISVVVVTHSPTVLERVPLARVRLVSRDSSRSFVLNSPSDSCVRSVVSSAPAKRLYVFVEDQVALLSGRVLVDIFYPAHSERCFFVTMEGADEIEKLLQLIPAGIGLDIVGLYDGDQRGKRSSGSWPVFFLPGCSSPESYFRTKLREVSVSLMARRCGVSEDAFMVSIEVAGGLDDHDWILSVAGSLRLDLSFFVRSMLLCFEEVGVLARADFEFIQ